MTRHNAGLLDVRQSDNIYDFLDRTSKYVPVSNLIDEIFTYSSDLPYNSFDQFINGLDSFLIKRFTCRRVSSETKRKHPILSYFFDKIEKINRNPSKKPSEWLDKIQSKIADKLSIEQTANTFKSEIDYNVINQIRLIIKKNYEEQIKKENPNFTVIKTALHLYGTVDLACGFNKKSNDSLEASNGFHKLSIIKENFEYTKLKAFLEDPSTTTDQIRERALLIGTNSLLSVTSNRDKLTIDFMNTIRSEVVRSIRLIKQEQSRLPKEEQNHNLLANLSHFEGHMYLDENKYIGATNEFKNEDYHRNCNFYLKNNIEVFVFNNATDPQILFEKVATLINVYQDEENAMYIFDEIYKNLQEIITEAKNRNENQEIIGGLNIFTAYILNVRNKLCNEQQKIDAVEYFEDAIRCYHNSNLITAKIACLSALNTLRKSSDLSYDETSIAESMYELLSPLTDDANAQYVCGVYMDSKDPSTAFSHFKNASDAGSLRAKTKVIKCLMNGNGTEQNKEMALSMALTLEDKEMPAEIYENSEGTMQDLQKTINCYIESLKYKIQNNKGRVKIGKIMIKIGDCYEKLGDFNKALEFYKIAENTFPSKEAIMKQICIYKKTDTSKYRIFLKIVADAGVTEAMYELAENYEYGINGFTKKEVEAFEYYKRAADLGDINSKFKLGEIFYYGTLIIQNDEEAFKYFKEAADFGHIKAQFKVAESYKLGIGTEQNHKKAFEYYKKAAANGGTNENFSLAECYKKGIGTKPDEEKAIKHYKQAATNGHKLAKLKLGNIYAKKNNVEELTEALTYYSEINGENFIRHHKITERIAMVTAKQKVCGFDKNTQAEEIKSVLLDTIDYLFNIVKTHEKREKKLKELIKAIDSRLSHKAFIANNFDPLNVFDKYKVVHSKTLIDVLNNLREDNSNKDITIDGFVKKILEKRSTEHTEQRTIQ